MSGAVLILGAGSGMGRALARALADEGKDLILAGRRVDDLERIASDCALRGGVDARIVPFDARAIEGHADFVSDCVKVYEDGLEGVLLCHGDMPDEDEMRADSELVRRMVEVNYISAISVLERAGDYLAERGSGWICAIGSVAGDRGRPGNYLYGSSKAALATYLQGLRARMAKRGVSVVTVKPGFVDTGMTYGRPGMFLVASPEKVAMDVLRGVRRDRAVVYTPGFWAGIMLIIRWIPDRIFNRLEL
jgi:short-subunit dehydrogenase